MRLRQLLCLLIFTLHPLNAAAEAVTTGIRISIKNPDCSSCFQSFKDTVSKRIEVANVTLNRMLKVIIITYRDDYIAEKPALNIEDMKQLATDNRFVVMRVRNIWPELEKPKKKTD